MGILPGPGHRRRQDKSQDYLQRTPGRYVGGLSETHSIRGGVGMKMSRPTSYGCPVEEN